ncbi:hypothetical protein NCS52_01404100 [Fusarium sp. LHS14.1]|nr:hypothetical protein NCS52_01404100 [Fusarium sp. LHS14.1]
MVTGWQRSVIFFTTYRFVLPPSEKMDHRCEPDSLLQEAYDLVTFNQLSDLSAAQLSIVKQPAKAVMRCMGNQGLSEREYDILTVYNDTVESATERYRLLKGQAKQIAHHRDTREITFSDRQIISLAAAAIAETTSEARESLKEDSLDQDELDVITADHRLNSDEPLFPIHTSGAPFFATTKMPSEPHNHHPRPYAPPPQFRAESVVSHAESILESIDAITDFTNVSSLSVSRISAEEAAKTRSYVYAHSDKDIDESLFPDTVTDLDTEIEAALQDLTDLLEYLVRLDGMIWRMKKKRDVLSDGRE